MINNKVKVISESFIKLNRKGEATGFVGVIFCIAIIIIIYFYNFQLFILNSEVVKTKDSLVAANLAVYKNINMTILADNSSNIVISDNNPALGTFKKHLKYNLFLDANDFPIGISYIKSIVKIEKFTVYNVIGNDVIIITFLPERGYSTMETKPGQKGLIKTPKGTIVTNTTLHTSISFDINVLNGKRKITLSEDTDIINTKSNL